MVDIVDKATRSRMMAGIRGKNTKPELTVRRALHAAGFRYRLHVKNLPGKPDIVLPKYRTVIFVHGCFWHGHDCKYFKMPTSRVQFWHNKILSNKMRDKRNVSTLRMRGWTVHVIWECHLRRKKNLQASIPARLFDSLSKPGYRFTQRSAN